MTGFPEWRQRLDELLQRHEHDPRSRWVQLATVRADGMPANRTVVLRSFLDPSDRVVFTTDLRGDKISQLGHSRWGEVCAYFGETREQFRILGRVAAVGADGNADESAARRRAWSSASPSSRQSFTWPAPGAPRADNAEFDRAAPDEPPTTFGILVLTPERVETLDLRPHPHARVVHTLHAGAWSSAAINP